ncbi:MAG: 50S ribosomal protein L29 [Crocosphaera sp.]|nr:50S ribosomal protein L29 [Crocosphaera sp.]
MALPKIEEVRKLSDEELAEEILATKRKLFDLRFQQATRQLEKTHEFKHTRHRIAQLLTVERERQLNINPSSTAAEEA